MDGFGIPDNNDFTEKLEELVTTLFKSLHDPSLPLKEMQDLMSAISSRIPSSVEESLQTCLSRYTNNITSVLSQFPSAQIINIINRYAASIKKKSDHDQFFMNTNPIIQLAQK
jgi:squalene cyclase